MKQIIGIGAVLLALAGCAAENTSDSSPVEVAAATYRASGPPSLTLMTMVNNRTGKGGHSSLLVNASQRVIFDPAGSFRGDRIVERGDVLYGITPAWLNAYRSAHARSTFHVVSQEIPVTAAQAEQALRLVQANGTVPGAFCTNATVGVLNQIEGLQFRSTFYPVNLMEQWAQLPSVRTTKLFENDSGELVDGIRAAMAGAIE